MSKTALILMLIASIGCTKVEKTAEVVDAEKGETVSLEYPDLPGHAALKVSFTAHFLGPWDGTGYAQWSPDRFICRLDDMTLIDSTFNNCHIPFVDNIWQSFPDPYHEGQLDFETARRSSIDGTYLYHGGHGASAIASQGFKWYADDLPSVDSSYEFSFTIPHTNETATLQFGTIWREELKNPTTYQIENLIVEPLKKVPVLNAKKEEQAWLAFFSGSPDASQTAWQEIYVTHPDKFIERVAAVISGDRQRRNYLVGQLEKGHTPAEAIYREVCLDPAAGDLGQQMHRILCLRELILGQNFFTREERHDLWRPSGFNDQTKALRKVCSFGGCVPLRDCAPIQKTRMRLTSYLRMINTEESLRLATKLRE